MEKVSMRNRKPGAAFVAAIGLLAACLPALCDAQAADGLSRCSRLEDDAERLACYDSLSRKGAPPAATSETAPTVPPPETAPSAPADAKPAETPAVATLPDEAPAAGEVPSAEAVPAEPATGDGEFGSLTDEVGAEALPRKEGGAPDFRPVRARVADCRKDHSGKYYFVFENGQVWKQRDSSRLYFRDCDFEVTISKDFFGYKMQVEGDDRETRIGRVR